MSKEYIDKESFVAELKERQEKAKEWLKEASCQEIRVRADAVMRCLAEIKLTLDKLPAADVKPVVRGEWIKCGLDRRPLCSKCGYEPLEITREYIVDGKPHSWDSAYNLSNFCPNCGADMRKDGENTWSR